MASIKGGQFHSAVSHEHAGAAHTAPDAGQYSLASVTHSTVAGGYDTVGGGNDTVGSGFDTVSGPGHASGFFTQSPLAGTEHVVATQTHEGGNTVLHLPDGSSMTIVGVHHIDATFFH
jgi:hypothetical protein